MEFIFLINLNKSKQIKFIRELYTGYEKELVNTQVQLFFFEQESENPTKMGKETADGLIINYNKRINDIQVILEGYRTYVKVKFNCEL